MYKKSKQIRPKSKKHNKQNKQNKQHIKDIKNKTINPIKTKKHPSKTKKQPSKTKTKNKDSAIKKSTTKASTINFVDAFTKVYENNIWGDNNDPNYEGSSGTGSDIKYNSKTYVPFLKHFIKKHKIKNVVDLGSGDFLVGLLIYDKMGVNYTGYDAYKKITDYNSIKHLLPKYTFTHLDFCDNKENIVNGDLCILNMLINIIMISILNLLMNIILINYTIFTRNI